MERNFLKTIEKKGYLNPYPSFWMVNTIGWILFVIVDTVIISPELLRQPYKMFTNAVEWSAAYFLTIGLRAVYRNYPYRQRPITMILLVILIFSQLASILLYITSHILYFIFENPPFMKFIHDVTTFFYISLKQTQTMPLMTTWSLLYFGIKFWMDFNTEKKRAEQAAVMAQSAQLQMLRYQVNPHFLFNTLSSLRALVSVDTQKAETMITKISEFLRYSLLDTENDEVPLSKEIQIIKNYLDIEKVRFNDRLQIEYRIDQMAEDYPVPIFILNPLIENAIKHGMRASKDPLKIIISAEVIDMTLHVSVYNSGKWKDQEDSSGTGNGLNNIRKRLAIHCPGNNSFEVNKAENSVEVKITLKKEVGSYNHVG